MAYPLRFDIERHPTVEWFLGSRWMTPDGIEDLGETWFWWHYGLAQRAAEKRRDAAARRVLVQAVANWDMYRMGIAPTLPFPGFDGRSARPRNRAMAVVAAWLAGDVALPGIGRAERPLEADGIAAFGVAAMLAEWGGTDAWHAIDDVGKVGTNLWRHRRKCDLVIVSRPADVQVKPGFLSPPPTCACRGR